MVDFTNWSVGRMLQGDTLCVRLVSDVDEKRHKLFFPEGKGLINGWNLLIEKLRALGLQGCSELPKPHWETKAQWGAEFHMEGFSHEASFAKVTKNGGGRQASTWVDVSDCKPRVDLGSLKFCLVGSWKTQPEGSFITGAGSLGKGGMEIEGECFIFFFKPRSYVIGV